VPIGLVAGFFGGWRDTVLMRFVDVLLSLPGILFAMAMIAVLGRSQMAALIAVGITGIPSFARITRAQVLSLRKRDFVTAVEALGGSSAYNMFRTVLPNSWSPILVQAVILSAVAILIEASLAFLGIGIPPPTPSWGEMLRTGKSFLHDAPTYAILPGLVLTMTILSLDTIGRVLGSALEHRHEQVGDAAPELKPEGHSA
jgi:ABC-type dipeptide/oligopeptide/nickel transport system permease subunit